MIHPRACHETKMDARGCCCFMAEGKAKRRKAGPAAQQKKAFAGGWAAALVVSLLGSAALCGGLLCAAAAVMLKTDASPQLAEPVSMLCSCAGAAFGGLLLARLSRLPGILGGMAIGLCLFGLIAAAALLEGPQEITMHSAFLAIALVCSGGLGGAAGVHLREKSRRQRG